MFSKLFCPLKEKPVCTGDVQAGNSVKGELEFRL